MEKYRYSKAESELIASSCIPMAVYQYIDGKAATIAISAGFCQMLGFEDMGEAFELLSNSIYRDVHPEDIPRIYEDILRFESEGGEFRTIYRFFKNDEYRIIRAIGKHEERDGIRLSVVTFADEGSYEETGENFEKSLELTFGMNHYQKGASFFDREMLKKEENRQYILENFDRALKEGWIDILYQPIIRAANGKVSDEEALSRWIDPKKGVFYPDEFIPILEENKLIHKLDLHVAKKVVKKMLAQKEAGLYVVPQTINLSGYDFYFCNMVDEIKKLLDEADIDTHKITIEIKERTVANGVNFIKDPVDRFKDLGFKVWMDDFGDRHSSPAVLQKIHFDAIKFDMQVMREFGSGEESRIIMAEILKLPIALGLETVVEGVETREQAEFLKEIGCTKLQGYYYEKPITLQEIIDRNEKGIQIGFENPDESDYYATIGKVNMYDISYALESDEKLSQSYFDTLPMAIFEMDDEAISMIRSNRSFREEFGDYFAKYMKDGRLFIGQYKTESGAIFHNALIKCARDGENVIMDLRLIDGRTAHLFIRELTVNPVKNTTALALVAISVAQDKDEGLGLTYSEMAAALSTDYIYVYLVDLDTENYVEYSSKTAGADFSNERHGSGFFEEAREAAKNMIFEEDLDEFLQSFSKEKVIKSIEDSGSFTYSCRLYIKGWPTYVHMKAGLTSTKGIKNAIILGVSNIDAQKRQQEAYERLKEERITYNRVAALFGDIVAIYTIDPDTEEYHKYVESEQLKDIGIGMNGDNFFEEFRHSGMKNVYLEDIDVFLKEFTRDKVLRSVERQKFFSMNIRIMLGGEPRYTNIKAAMISERGGSQLIVGLINIDDQVKRDLEYASNLTAARNEANLDALTGVKNRHAYIDVEEQLDRLIDERKITDFAVVVCDINGLKQINDNLGHKAGDEYLKSGCELICDIFRHSPVFRVGGDEFVVIVQGHGLGKIDKLMKLIQDRNEENMKGGKVIVAAGMSHYQNDASVSAVFERADAAMYENKVRLKMMQKELKV
ncbi:EAL domain-containing protein [Butyrivibrio sp. DSM 10294]|uniref:EAL domain-containing protein n=1 Tax=Butyrivibrio sp. DSM 10294 TaxID=2972457 RepID=UPI00234EEC27|nr:EAL domain-containing protein [Butyrivibrio sp. DSM 10294]MDC7294245.1 EAL domain-containing protein [Butyrivibrio sp. DSM 10294]